MKRILCYGDSNTWGYNAVNGERYPENIRWTGILRKRLHADVLEEGLCGRTGATEDSTYPHLNGLRPLPMLLSALKPIDAAVMMLGTNDCKTCYHPDAADITAGIGKCVDELLKVLPAEKILLVSPLCLEPCVVTADEDFDIGSVEISKQLPALYAELAASKGVHFMATGDHARACPVDGEHLDENGHAAFAEAVCSALSEYGMV